MFITFLSASRYSYPVFKCSYGDAMFSLAAKYSIIPWVSVCVCVCVCEHSKENDMIRLTGLCIHIKVSSLIKMTKIQSVLL